MNLNTIILIGKPGSGKGTQAKLLSEKTGFAGIGSGELFRGLAKEDSFVGRKLQTELDQGLLMPDWFAAYLFQKSVLSLAPEQGIVFDGFGRKVPEAKIVLDVLGWLERPFRAVHLKVSDEEIRHRLGNRAATSGRADDYAIDKRLDEYRTFTDPAIEMFRAAGMLVEIPGEGTVEEIHAQIMESLTSI